MPSLEAIERDFREKDLQSNSAGIPGSRPVPGIHSVPV